MSDASEAGEPHHDLVDHAAEESDKEAGVVDSSDEDEVDDEEEMRKLRDGFIVDDEEEEGDNSDERKRRRHKKKRHRDKQPTEDTLDEDDLDLLLENTGSAPRPVKSKFKRLKRGGDEQEASEGGDGRSRDALDDIFSDDEQIQEDDNAGDLGGSRRAGNGMDEMDDFIEEDSDDAEGADRERESNRRYRQQPASAMLPQYRDIDQEKLDQLYEIFGDGTDYEWALALEDDENEYGEDEEEGDGLAKLTDIFEQSELKEKMLTEEDNEIRATDIPERYQTMRASVKNYKLNGKDFELEKTWVSEILGAEKLELLSKYPTCVAPFNEAVGSVLNFICEESLEVPFIFTHRKDFITHTIKDAETEQFTLIDLLKEDDLWRIVQLDIEFHNVLEKRKTLQRLLAKLSQGDKYDAYFKSLTKLQELQDFYDYICFTYSKELREIEELPEDKEEEEDNYDPEAEEEEHEEKKQPKFQKTKRHAKYSTWERIRESELYEVVKKIGITAAQVGTNISGSTRQFFTQDSDEDPEDLLEALAGAPNSAFPSVNASLGVVEKMYAEELFHEPKIRSIVRSAFTQYARVNTKLTEKGKVKITKGSPNYEFKYLINKEISSFVKDPSLLLRMLEAEQDSLIQVHLALPSLEGFQNHIFKASLASDSESEISSKWNNIRKKSLDLMMKKLIPLVCMNIKEELRKECERGLFFQVRESVVKKLDQAPLKPAGFVAGTIPETLTISCGEGNFATDAVVGVYTNTYGEVKDIFKFDENPIKDPEFATSFVRKFNEIRPDVIGINGYNVNTKRLYDVIHDIIEKHDLRPETHSEGDYREFDDNKPPVVELVYVYDEIARKYQSSVRANDEFPQKPPLAKYCIALGRYLQSPLLEYVNLGKDVIGASFHKYQYLLNDDRLLEAITSSLVDIVNMVGVDINQAVREPYFGAALQYVSGLGPRKASGILQNIQTKASTGLVNRTQLVTLHITTKNVFINCASFLRFYESSSRYSESAEILDETRIHPEDYVLATKMAADALELDEEDIEDLESRPGEGVIRKLDEGTNLQKLNDLILEDYAIELETKHRKRKRATLYMIKDELQNHFEEIRHKFHILTSQEIFTSLTGETTESFYVGVVCPFVLRKVSSTFVSGATQFMVSVNVRQGNILDYTDRREIDSVFHIQQAVRAKILEIDYDSFRCEASLLPKDVDSPEDNGSARNPDEWDDVAESDDIRAEAMKLENETKAKKFVKHPFFHNFNAREAEEYLASLQRGDLVIRPSSKGTDHLAITWKVDNNLYQHLDVVEKVSRDVYNEEQKTYSLKGHKYSDLDELITFHIYKLARNVELMVSNDKFYRKSRSEAEEYLESYVKANSGRGYYIFCFDHKHPGWFTLLFKANEKARISTIPVEVTPNGYKLAGYDYSSVGLLTNGFKQLMLSKSKKKSQNFSSGNRDQAIYNNYSRGY